MNCTVNEALFMGDLESLRLLAMSNMSCAIETGGRKFFHLTFFQCPHN